MTTENNLQSRYSNKLGWVILSCFFFSGMTGLIYEVLWSRIIVRIIGAAPFAISIILTVFMGGLGLGSYIASRTIDRVKNPLRLIKIYALLEILIGVYALAVPLLVKCSEPFFALLYNRFFEYFLLFNFLTFIGCSMLLCIPVIAMGATLPILCRFYISRLSALGTHAGRLYGFNTIGAALGSLLCGFWLIGRIGIWGTLFLAVGINLFIGLVCFIAAAYMKSRAENVETEEDEPFAINITKPEIAENENDAVDTKKMPAVIVAALIIFAVSGFCSMSYEVFWTKLLGLIVGPTTYSFTIILATFISCLALGSMFFGWLSDKTKQPIMLLLITQVAAAVFVLISSQLMGNSQLFFSKIIYHSKQNFILLHGIKTLALFLFMLPPCLCLGATFPLVSKIYTRTISTVGHSIGSAYMINSIGAVLGSFCAGFILIPAIGKENGIRLVAGLQLLTVLILGGVILIRSRQKIIHITIISLLATMGLGLCWKYPHWNRYTLSKGKYHRFHEIDVNYERLGWLEALLHGSDILEKKEEGRLVYNGDGVSGFTSVMEYPNPVGHDHYSIMISGKSDASSRGDMRTQTLLAHFPMLFHPHAKKVMVVGLASGVTAGEVLCYPVDQVDVLEINKQVVEASNFFEPWNNNVLGDSRTRLIIQDARAHLQLTRETYDVIISEPSNPWMAGLAALFTCDFFQLAYDRLENEGIYVQFFHSYEMDWETFSLVGRSFTHVFPNSLLLVTEPLGPPYGYDFLLVGFKGSRLLLENAEKNILYAQRSGNIRLQTPELLYRMLVSEDSSELFEQGPLNTDTHPRLEFAAPQKMYLAESQNQYNSDPLIWKNLTAKQKFTPETKTIIDEITSNIDRQIDYAAYALSVHSPFSNMVDMAHASDAQKSRFEHIQETYCQNNILELSLLQDPALVQKCRQIIINRIRERLESIPDQWYSYYTLGNQLMAMGQFEEAKEAYANTRKYKENSFILNDYAVAQAQTGDISGAIKTLQYALTLEPNSIKVHCTLGYFYMMNRQMEDAESHLLNAMEIEPANELAISGLISMYINTNRFNKAADMCLLFLKIQPDNANIRNQLAGIYLQSGKKQQAVETLSATLNIQPSHQQTLISLQGIISSADPDEAIRLSAIACKITKNNHPTVIMFLSTAYSKAQRWQEAIASAEQALELVRNRGNTELAERIQTQVMQLKSQGL